MTALASAASRDTILIDMDLTGTSLSDVLNLQPPRFPETDGVLQLREQPSGYLTGADASALIEKRRDAEDGASAVGVPFLNDYILFQTPSWDTKEDIDDPSRMGWKMEGAPANLRVLPSSALPRDLEKILPLVFDEERAAFLEGRLEYLLEALVPESGERVLVFDTPPTIPGLSRAVLSLAIRLGGPGEKQPLAVDGYIPRGLESTRIVWDAFIVSTIDWQDVRAAVRWLEMLTEEERDVVRWLINRAGGRDVDRDTLLRSILAPSLGRPDIGASVAGTGAAPGYLPNPSGASDTIAEGIMKDVCWVEEHKVLASLFRSESRNISAPENWLAMLERPL